jgi:histidinol-phosphatase (PHP family)
MKLPADSHTHNYLCRHAEGRLVEYAATAIQRSVAEIGFSDHAPMPTDGYDEWRMLLNELPEYLEMAEEAKKKYPDYPSASRWRWIFYRGRKLGFGICQSVIPGII